MLVVTALIAHILTKQTGRMSSFWMCSSTANISVLSNENWTYIQSLYMYQLSILSSLMSLLRHVKKGRWRVFFFVVVFVNEINTAVQQQPHYRLILIFSKKYWSIFTSNMYYIIFWLNTTLIFVLTDFLWSERHWPCSPSAAFALCHVNKLAAAVLN